MTTYTLSEASKLTGVDYGALYGRVATGKMPTTKDNQGRHVVQEADLDRMYPPEGRAAQIAKVEAERQRNMENARLAREAPVPAPAPPAPSAVTLGSSIPRGEVELLKWRIEMLKEDLEDARRQRDEWKRLAERLLDKVLKREADAR